MRARYGLTDAKVRMNEQHPQWRTLGAALAPYEFTTKKDNAKQWHAEDDSEEHHCLGEHRRVVAGRVALCPVPPRFVGTVCCSLVVGCSRGGGQRELARQNHDAGVHGASSASSVD
jgi:hypothetical protein